MQAVSRALRSLVIVLCLFGVVYAVVANYSFVFSKSVRGEVMEVERVIQPTAIVGSNMTADQMFSFAILVRAESGEIFASSSTDRQWAVIRKGYCVEARLYPYPPWDMEAADTYHNARLVKVMTDCKHFATPSDAAAGAANAPATGAAAGTAALSGVVPAASPVASPVASGGAAAASPEKTYPLPGNQPNGHPALPPQKTH